MRTTTALNAAGETDPGLQRDVNEDRFHVDVSRGLFIVVDGVGGQAAGGKAADVAMEMLRSRLERETGAVVDRIREAITVANNEIHRAAATRPEWKGMACVLTVAVVEEHRATIGHVGDTRLYCLRSGQIDKITRDHSPVGEREDAQEISESEAMRHPRRNEVYRDVGSERHAVDDPDFIDVHEIPFGPDEALLLCSDGLTDLVESTTIYQIVRRLAGQPAQVAKALVQAAKKGDLEAFSELVRRYDRNVFRIAQHITHNEEDAQDVVQDAFLKAYQNLDQFQGNSKFYTWLVRIAVNEALMKLRRRRPERTVSLDEEVKTEEDSLPREVADWSPNPEQQYNQAELREILSKTIQGLPPGFRTVFVLRDVEGLSTEETAEALDLSIPAVKSRLLRARLQLRERLSRYFQRRDGGNGAQKHESGDGTQ
jgi:RNA polymerase sigma-70 factor (ECF subfamily)